MRARKPAPFHSPVQHLDWETMNAFCPLPVLGRWSLHIDRGDGQLLTLDSLWMTASRWRSRPESTSADWRPKRLGPFVLAMRIVG